MRPPGPIKGAIFPPGSRNIVKVALSYRASGEAGAAGHGLDRHFVEALALLTCPAAQNRVEGV